MNEFILIADDEDDLSKLIQYNLERENYRTLVVRNGKETIEAMRNRPPDLLLLDVMMPGLNGWEVCRIVKNNIAWKSIPIIMLTALSDEKDRITGLTLGADDYMSKPFSVAELMLKIRKQMERRSILKNLQSSEREKETSLRYFIHEMGNSLTTISGFSSLALRKNGEQRHLKMINTIALHAESLLKDASLLSQLEKNRQPLPVEPVDIVAITREVVDFFYDQAARKHIEIHIVESMKTTVLANKTALRQVLINIFSNAIKYNREGGKIWACFEVFDNHTNITLRDEGCGISKDEIPRIFEKFYRAGGSEAVKGAGLGLYIVKVLTESMGGKITVTSSPGFGSTFILTFLQETVICRTGNENRYPLLGNVIGK